MAEPVVKKLLGKNISSYRLLNAVLALFCLLCLGLSLKNWLYEAEIEPSRDGSIANAAARPVNWRWFADVTVDEASGNVRRPGQQQAVVEEELDEASLDASLIGVLITPQDAYATLRTSAQGEQVFRLGDEIESGIELIGIEPYRIIVDQRGRRLQVSMEKIGNTLRNAPPANRESQAVIRSKGPVQNFTIDDMVAATPVDVTGYESGLQLDSISEELRTLAGLQAGDVVVEVNGSSVQSLLDNPEQWINLGANSQLPVTIVREGQSQTIYVDASALASRFMPSLGSQLGN